MRWHRNASMIHNHIIIKKKNNIIKASALFHRDAPPGAVEHFQINALVSHSQIEFRVLHTEKIINPSLSITVGEETIYL